MKKNLCSEWFNSKRQGLLRSVSLALLGVIVAGCPAEKQAPKPAAGDKIVIRGSNTIGEELAPRLIAEYQKEHPAVAFDLETKGTGYGLAALRAGQCDIAAASRTPLKAEQEMEQASGIELNEYVIGSYSVAVVVHAGNPVGDLTKEQVRDIFTGAVQNWKEVGGPDAPIHLYIRDPISGTYLGFQELVMGNQPYGPSPQLLTSYAEIVGAVAKDATGIGCASIELATKPGVKGVVVGGVSPTIAAVNKGEYPYARVLRLYTDKAKEKPAARAFIQFVLSPRGQEILAQAGFTPRP